MTTDGQLPEALTIIDPSHVEYETARATFNATIDKHPAFIVRCSTVEDVCAAVHFLNSKDYRSRSAAAATASPVFPWARAPFSSTSLV